MGIEILRRGRIKTWEREILFDFWISGFLDLKWELKFQSTRMKTSGRGKFCWRVVGMVGLWISRYLERYPSPAWSRMRKYPCGQFVSNNCVSGFLSSTPLSFSIAPILILRYVWLVFLGYLERYSGPIRSRMCKYRSICLWISKKYTLVVVLFWCFKTLRISGIWISKIKLEKNLQIFLESICLIQLCIWISLLQLCISISH